MGLEAISLFSGIGGDTLAAEWAGFETILFVENNAYCQKVLKKHWPDVPILEDIFNVTKETIQEAVGDSESRRWSQSSSNSGNGIQVSKEAMANATATGEEHRLGIGKQARVPPITLITGGFPQQKEE